MRYGDLWQLQMHYPRQEGHMHEYGGIIDRVHEGTVILRCGGCERPEAFPLVAGRPRKALTNLFSNEPAKYEAQGVKSYTMLQ